MAQFVDQGKIGSGGFGEVVRCRRDSDGRFFAKKQLQPGVDLDGVKRFAREVRILSSLDHPNIVRVVARRLETPPYFCVMPLYSRSLRAELPSLVGDQGRIDQIFSSVLDGMEYAHQQGVIHRDLKPENILLNSDADVVIADFGLGRVVDADSSRMTQSGWQIGTPLYMPPEQLKDAKSADARSDIFSLGRILYELFTGPLLSAVQDTTGLPAGVELIIQRCTKSDPAARFQSVTDLKNAWRSLLDASRWQSELDELALLRADLGAPGPYPSASARRIVEILSKHEGDDDLLHQTLMQVHADAFAAIHAIDAAFVRRIVRRFATRASESGWGFDYTDRIADQCRSLHDATGDVQIRSDLAMCVLRVGEAHNRWHVLRVFAAMVQGAKSPGEGYALAEALRGVDSYVRERAVPYLTRVRLNPELQSLFPLEAEDSE